MVGRMVRYILAPCAAALLALFFSGAEVQSELSEQTRYVTPSTEIAVRRGKGIEYKIIALVEDGTTVELLEEDETHALVELPDGKQGWMLKRFLSTEPPLTELVATLKDEREQSRIRIETLERERTEMAEALRRTEDKLAAAAAERERIAAAHEALQRESRELLDMKSNLMADKARYEALAQQFELVQQENDRLKEERAINWFLAGGGVLVVGMILGRISFSSRKRKSSLIS